MSRLVLRNYDTIQYGLDDVILSLLQKRVVPQEQRTLAIDHKRSKLDIFITRRIIENIKVPDNQYTEVYSRKERSDLQDLINGDRSIRKDSLKTKNIMFYQDYIEQRIMMMQRYM